MSECLLLCWQVAIINLVCNRLGCSCTISGRGSKKKQIPAVHTATRVFACCLLLFCCHPHELIHCDTMCDGQNSIHMVRSWHRFTRPLSLHTVTAPFSQKLAAPATPSQQSCPQPAAHGTRHASHEQSMDCSARTPHPSQQHPAASSSTQQHPASSTQQGHGTWLA